jgi:hypothetical protein
MNFFNRSAAPPGPKPTLDEGSYLLVVELLTRQRTKTIEKMVGFLHFPWPPFP